MLLNVVFMMDDMPCHSFIYFVIRMIYGFYDLSHYLYIDFICFHDL